MLRLIVCRTTSDVKFHTLLARSPARSRRKSHLPHGLAAVFCCYSYMVGLLSSSSLLDVYWVPRFCRQQRKNIHLNFHLRLHSHQRPCPSLLQTIPEPGDKKTDRMTAKRVVRNNNNTRNKLLVGLARVLAALRCDVSPIRAR